MRTFFYPESLVIIGVSVSRLNLGKIILTNNAKRGFAGRLYGVGREEGEVEGKRVYTKISDLPEIPDVAIIITPAETVPDMLRECGLKGIRRVVIESGGFSEFSGSAGDLEKKLLDIAGEFDIKFIGPNCVGTINFETNIMMPFAFASKFYEAGDISIITQSGGVGNTFLQALPDNHVFLNKFVSVGNKLQLDEVDFLSYYLSDPATSAVLAYLEGFSRGRAFFDCAMAAEKPIIVQKSNRSAMSAKIAQSHTSALSSSDDIVDAAFRQSAVIRADDEEDMISAAKILQLPPMRGRRVAVLSRSGGHAVISTDACERFGFELISFPQSFIDRIKSMYKSRVISHQNPLDLGEIFDYTIFTNILREAISLPEVDGVLFNHLYQAEYESVMSRSFLDSVGKMTLEFDKPVSIAMISDLDEVVDISKNHPYPTYSSPFRAAQALHISATYWERRNFRNHRGDARLYEVDSAIVDGIREIGSNEERIPLTDEALSICAAAGLRPVRGMRISSAEDAEAADLKYPLALKLLSRDASHKSDVGGVKLNINSRNDLTNALSDMRASIQRAGRPITVDGYFVHEMAPAGTEFFVGARHDPCFGPVVLTGMGGIFIEIFKDRAIRLAPVTEAEAFEMLRELKAFPILEGARGGRPLDIDSLVEVICRISSLAYSHREISEIDLNPVMVYPRGQGVGIVDARVFFAEGAAVSAVRA
ncbi:MAG TPA: acetate--CoA ligase family protein [Spirochaetota bacterium]|nr:acetate--CoA ligase family protein [Spirochaetota bacterium]